MIRARALDSHLPTKGDFLWKRLFCHLSYCDFLWQRVSFHPFTFLLSFFFFHFFFYSLFTAASSRPNGISPMGNSGCFPRGKLAATESRYPSYCARWGHRTPTWTMGSLTCAQMLMHAIAHGGVRTHVRESALKVDSGRKIPCRTGESNLRQRRAGPML